MFNQLTNTVQHLLQTAFEIAYFSRGCIQYEDVLWRTPIEKDIMLEFIKKRLEVESKKPYPVY